MYTPANDLLSQFTDIPEEQVRLKKVTVEDLGLPNGSTVEEVLAAAKKKGLTPCPPWVGPQYRMECDDDKYALIGMEPLTDSGGVARIFDVTSVGLDRYLYSYPTGRRWRRPAYEWLFVSDK